MHTGLYYASNLFVLVLTNPPPPPAHAPTPRYRLGAEGVLLDLNTTVRLEKPLDPLLRLRCLSRLRLPVVELTDCEHHSGGERDEESVARTVLFLNNFRARIVGAYAARGVVPPQIDTE